MMEQISMDTTEVETTLKKNDIEGNINDFEFNNTVSIIDSINNIAKFTFNQVISGTLVLENLPRQKQQELKDSMTTYINSTSNKDYILGQYFDNQDKIPGWISGIIENTYYNDIGKIELNKFFDENNLISLGHSIVGENWDGSNISGESPEISNICPGSFFSEEQFISEFNRRNTERINKNIIKLDALDIIQLSKDFLRQEGGKLYVNDKEFTEGFFDTPKFLDIIYPKLGPENFVNINELKKLLLPEIKNKRMTSLLENIKDEDKENKFGDKNNGEISNFFGNINLKYSDIYDIPSISTNPQKIKSKLFPKVKFGNCRLSKKLGTVIYENAPTQSIGGNLIYETHKETFYSQKKLPGTGLEKHYGLEGRHIAEDGTVRDGNGYIVVACNYLPRFSTIMTTLGPGKVYDRGGMKGKWIDIYTNR